MPRHPDFEKIYQAFMWRYCKEKTECDTGKQYYYAWLNKLGLDDTKPYQRPQESFNWIKPHIQFIKEDDKAEYFKIEALFPLSSMNNNVYTKDELIRASRTLIGKPTNLNHTSQILSEVQTVDADYEDDIVGCLDRLEKGSKALQMIKSGEILQVSIEAECLRGTELTLDGSVCKGQVFTGKAYLTKDVLPGVPLTRIIPVENLVENFQGIENISHNKTDAKTDATIQTQATMQDARQNELQEKIRDLQEKYDDLKAELDQLKKPKEEPKKEPCRCVLTKEGFWARFHQLRSEGASKSEAFRLVSLEVIEAANKKAL